MDNLSNVLEKSGKETSAASENSRLRAMTKTALMSAVICILGPVSIQIGPVPIAFANLAIFFSVYLLGMKKGTISCVIYILLGLIGLPVFTGAQGGVQKLFGVTGGYIFGYVFMAAIAGFFVERWKKNRVIHFAGMLLGQAACDLFGTAWFVVLTGSTVWGALCVCVFPFIIGDSLKILAAVTVGSRMRARLVRAGVEAG